MSFFKFVFFHSMAISCKVICANMFNCVCVSVYVQICIYIQNVYIYLCVFLCQCICY